MQTAGVADVGDVWFFGECLVERGKGADVVDVFDVALLIGAHSWRDDVGETAHAVGDDLNRIAEQSAKVAGVALTDAAETDDEDFHEGTPELWVRVGDALRPETADEGELLANPVHFISVFAAGDLQGDPAVVADALHGLKDVGEVGGAFAKRHRRDATGELRATILDVNGANAITVGGKLFACDIAKT